MLCNATTRTDEVPSWYRQSASKLLLFEYPSVRYIRHMIAYQEMSYFSVTKWMSYGPYGRECPCPCVTISGFFLPLVSPVNE